MSTWLLLRGLSREHGHWGRFPELLAQRLPAGTRVLTIDLPGAGVLQRMSSPMQVEVIAEICRKQTLHDAGPFVLLGLSMGGMVAAAWAAMATHEVAGCVLVNSSMRSFSPLNERLRMANLPRLLALLVSRDPWHVERTVLELTSASPSVHCAVLAEWVAIRKARPVSRLNVLRQLIAAARYVHPQPAPAVPTLLINSAADRLVDPRCSHVIAERWQVALRTHPTAGHDLPLDDGHWLAEQVAGWGRDL